ncbi:MAG: NADH dehydrogenase (quinone) subunit D [Armatimonadetes bacterium]|nr:NADH dehydrogenase (quinone) subunit D [Armatimonadota bacterium]
MNIGSTATLERVTDLRQRKILSKVIDKDTTISLEGRDPLENTMILNMGPQHPATHGVLRVLLRLDGETVEKCIPELGYLHRGYEKLGENMTYHEFLPHTDRLDYLSPMSNNVAYAMAVEKVLGLEIPPRAAWIRTMICELARISSHLLAMGAMSMDCGAITMLLWTFRERERLYDIFEKICGARFTTSYTRIGGVANDFTPDIIPMIRKFIDQFPAQLRDFEGLVNRNRIFVERVSGIGYMSAEEAIQLGMTGPCLRGSGVAHDLRRDEPYLLYDQLDFDVITYADGDCFARYMVRGDEMKESVKIVRQLLDKIPDGPVLANEAKQVLPGKVEIYTKMEELIQDFMLVNFGQQTEPGEIYSCIESPKGELGFYITSDGSGQAWRMKIRSPSFCNLQALQPMCEGAMISDVVAIIGSIDPVMGEADK